MGPLYHLLYNRIRIYTACSFIYIYIHIAPYGENLDPHFLVQLPLTPNQLLIYGANNWQPILTSGICSVWCVVHGAYISAFASDGVHGAYIAAFGLYGSVHISRHLVCRDAADVICVNNKADHNVDFCHRYKDALIRYMCQQQSGS